MPGLRPPVGGVSRYRAAVAVLGTLLAAAILYVARAALSPANVATVVLFVVYVVGSAFDRVRTHPLYDLASAVLIAAMFGLWYLGSDGRSPILLALFVLTLVGVAVEAYNYRYGTSYLRIG